MKKTTLITTIAMIVVVVIALSTATYAWFSSQEETYANLSFSVNADTGLTVLVNSENIFSTSDSASFTATDFLPTPGYGDPTPQNGIRAGVWVPNQEDQLALKPNDNGVDNITLQTSQVATTFVTGIVDKKTDKVGPLETMQMSPDIINVENNTSGTKYILLTIYVGYAANPASRYAATGVAAYVADKTAVKAETDYYTANSTINTANSSIVDGNVFIKRTSRAAFTDSSATTGKGNHVGSIVDAATSAAATTAGITLANCYTLKAIIGQLGQGENANFVIYTWLDGGYLTDNAKGCQLEIVYAFTPQDTDTIA